MSTLKIVILIVLLAAASGPVGIGLIWLLVNYMPK